jgi:hypothetical protein
LLLVEALRGRVIVGKNVVHNGGAKWGKFLGGSCGGGRFGVAGVLAVVGVGGSVVQAVSLLGLRACGRFGFDGGSGKWVCFAIKYGSEMGGARGGGLSVFSAVIP